jgi:hexosaminidase
MQRRKLAAPADVWNVFYQQVNATLRQHHLFASGWEELGSRRGLLQGSDQLVPNPYFAGSGFTLYVWRNIEGAEDLAYRLANAGYDTVLVPATRLYFDMARYPSPDEPGQDWAAYAGLQEAFSYIPYDDVRRVPTDATPLPGKVALTDPGKRHVRGLEGALFTETVRGPARLDYMIMPRLLALAERAWAPDPEWAQARERAQAEALYAAAWSRFVNQLGKRELPRLDAEQAGIQYRIAPPGLRRVDGQVLVNQQLPGFALRYTSDGSEPTVASPLVSGPIVAQGIIRVAAFDRNGRSGRSSRIANP